ncbi:MAG: hypothetical protein FJ294_02010 [Planctomycetes bacterium]|nr:hypothetical protein [Planctomycetota bacterium]
MVSLRPFLRLLVLALGASPLVGQDEPRYRTCEELERSLDELAALEGTRVARLSHPLLAAAGVVAFEIASKGPVDRSGRPTLLVLGGFDGLSLSGAEAAVACARALGSPASPLLPDISVVVIPCAARAALTRYRTQQRGDGGDDTPVDTDRDGSVDEDGPDDLDGDGLILSMLVEDSAGGWVLSDDDRFLVPAGPLDAPRLALRPEGRDDDGDGRYNEDGPGGVALERNFPLERPAADPSTGTLPLSQPAARALADFVLERRVFAVLSLQGAHGALASPGGTAAIESWAVPDRALYELCVREFRTATGRAQSGALSRRAARLVDQGGVAQDWFAVVGGALSLELAPWGPGVVVTTPGLMLDARFERAAAPASRPPLERDLRWRPYVDDVTGGAAFVPWTPHLLGSARVRIGGWKPWTIENPPPSELARALAGIERFALALAQGAPRLEIEVRAERDGRIATLRARVRNAGRLPTSLAARSAVRSHGGVTLELALEDGQDLLAGRELDELAALAGGESSAEREWIVLAPEGSSLTLRAVAPWCNPSSVKVRP